MKNLLLFSVLIMSVLFTAQAGYIVRGVTTSIPPATDMKNFTLNFDAIGEPIAAASMNEPGRNSIVIVHANSNRAHIFTIMSDENANIEVRDIHYVRMFGFYLLCGSHGTQAFVASIDRAFTTMHFVQCPEADIYYSIWGDYPGTINPALTDYFVCGKKGNIGLIGSLNRNLQLTTLRYTENWEWHKIVLKQDPSIGLRLVVSGRNTEYDHIGYTVFYPTSTLIFGYRWTQNTDPASLCVVADNMLDNSKIILASSLQNMVTLSSVTYPIPSVDAYHFSWGTPLNKFYVQDIETIAEDIDISISVAGYMIRDSLPFTRQAWYGTKLGLPGSTNIMDNNNYFGSSIDRYEHYKVKYYNGIAYTGGYFQNNRSMSVLFSTPQIASDCDYPYESLYSYEPNITLTQFTIPFYPLLEHSNIPISVSPYQMSYYLDCLPFKEGGYAPELVMPTENESEIITYYDRITVKDTPTSTNYQIFSIHGQLMQTGTTNPDISTINLNKGIYILRLESGKAFKFVK